MEKKHLLATKKQSGYPDERSLYKRGSTVSLFRWVVLVHRFSPYIFQELLVEYNSI